MVYEAREGKHDDKIVACALAVWWLSRPKNQPAAFGRYGLAEDGKRMCVIGNGKIEVY
jgi:hypothetical protein